MLAGREQQQHRIRTYTGKVAAYGELGGPLLVFQGPGVSGRHPSDANAHLSARPPLAVILSTRNVHGLDLDGEPVVDEVPGGTMDFPIRCPRVIGQFKIADCWASWTKTSHRYTFAGNWNALGDTSGIVYAPGPRVKDSSDQWHLTGPWYAWTCNC